MPRQVPELFKKFQSFFIFEPQELTHILYTFIFCEHIWRCVFFEGVTSTKTCSGCSPLNKKSRLSPRRLTLGFTLAGCDLFSRIHHLPEKRCAINMRPTLCVKIREFLTFSGYLSIYEAGEALHLNDEEERLSLGEAEEKRNRHFLFLVWVLWVEIFPLWKAQILLNDA